MSRTAYARAVAGTALAATVVVAVACATVPASADAIPAAVSTFTVVPLPSQPPTTPPDLSEGTVLPGTVEGIEAATGASCEATSAEGGSCIWFEPEPTAGDAAVVGTDQETGEDVRVSFEQPKSAPEGVMTADDVAEETLADPLPAQSANEQYAAQTVVGNLTAASPMTPVALPSWCGTPYASVRKTRTQWCQTRKFVYFNWIDSTNGTSRLGGTATGYRIIYAYMSASVSHVIHQENFRMLTKTGKTDVGVVGAFKCTGQCDYKRGEMKFRKLTLGIDVVYVGDISPTLSNRQWKTNRTWFETRMGESEASALPMPNAPAVTRCDNASSGYTGKGCVVPSYFPTLSFSKSGKAAAVAVHIEKAQASGLLGKATPLRRTTTTATISGNRSRACPSYLTIPSGYSCDEYPFASTTQGAMNGGQVRIFSGCHLTTVAGSGSLGYSRCLVPTTANSSQGGSMSAFYRNQRILHDDQYYVRITS